MSRPNQYKFPIDKYNNVLDYLSGRSYNPQNLPKWANLVMASNDKLYWDNKEIIPDIYIDETISKIYNNPTLSGGRDKIFHYIYL